MSLGEFAERSSNRFAFQVANTKPFLSICARFYSIDQLIADIL